MCLENVAFLLYAVNLHAQLHTIEGLFTPTIAAFGGSSA
jgi:hypothetical protein